MPEKKEVYEVIAEVRVLSKKFRLSRKTRGRFLGLTKRGAFRAKLLLDKEGVFLCLYDQMSTPGSEVPLLTLEQGAIEEEQDLPEVDLSEFLDE